MTLLIALEGWDFNFGRETQYSNVLEKAELFLKSYVELCFYLDATSVKHFSEVRSFLNHSGSSKKYWLQQQLKDSEPLHLCAVS